MTYFSGHLHFNEHGHLSFPFVKKKMIARKLIYSLSSAWWYTTFQ